MPGLKTDQNVFDSSLDPVPGNFSIYVTNKTNSGNEIYVRLRGDKVQESEKYTRILNETQAEISGGGAAGVGQGGKAGLQQEGQERFNVAHKHEEESRKRQVFSCLTQGGFTFLPHGEVTPFAVENSDRLMYISVHDGSRSWCWNMQVNPRQYGCVTIKEDDASRISVFPSNPEPHWFQENKENPAFPSNAVKVHQRSDYVVVYLAKVNYKPDAKIQFSVAVEALGMGALDHTYLTGIWRENGKLCRERRRGLEFDEYATLDLLLARKYEWVKAQRGNTMPPNAVKTTIVFGARAEEWYVGRVGGENICAVSITDGMISYFTDVNGFNSTSGDNLLLTVDPSV